MKSSSAPSSSPISVVIPVIDDAECLDRLCEQLRRLPHVREIIVADGGSVDRLPEVVDRHRLALVASPKGRGVQMNRGAQLAGGEVFWFLHADTLPDKRSTVAILKALENPEIVGGAFRFSLSEPRWYGSVFAWFIGIRSTLFSMPYGDQGYFVRREGFESVGGFPEIPIMEDVEFLRRIKGQGQFKTIDLPIGISPRRWDREGVMGRTLLNWFLFMRHRCGAAPEDLVRFYPRVSPGSDREAD